MKNLLCFLVLLLCCNVGQAQQVIENPSYETRGCGIDEVIKVELNPNNTRVHLKCTYSPNWWVSIDSTSYIQSSEGGKKYYPLSIEGTTFGKRSFTPACGYQIFIMTFPPLPADIRKIDYKEGESERWNIYGIDLTGEEKEKRGSIPSDLQGNWFSTDGCCKWTYGFYDSIAIVDNTLWKYADVIRKGKKFTFKLKSENKELILYATAKKDGSYTIGYSGKNDPVFSKNRPRQTVATDTSKSFPVPFFDETPARLQGYMNGFDSRSCPSTGIIFLDNSITNEDFPIVVQFFPDGRFEATLPLIHPKICQLIIKDKYIPFYLEPGQTLTMFLDWEDILAKDRFPAINDYPIRKHQYMGPLASENAGVFLVEGLIPFNYNQFKKNITEQTPGEYKSQTEQNIRIQEDSLKALIARHPMNKKTIELIRLDLKVRNGEELLDFIMYRNWEKENAPDNKILQIAEDSTYYDFLQQMPLNDEKILISENFNIFINRLEFADFLRKSFPEPIKMDFFTYLKKSDIKLTSEEEELKTYSRLPDSNNTIDSVSRHLYNKQLEIFYNKYDKEFKQYMSDNRLAYRAHEEYIRDSILRNYLHLQPNLVCDIMKTRSLKYLTKRVNREEGYAIFNMVTQNISHPTIKAEGKKIFEKNCPEDAHKIIQFPAGRATDLFRKIIAPHKGNVILVDFWATSCGPCVQGIKSMKTIREKYSEQGVSFVFITDERSSPLAAYDNIMKDVKGDKYRLSVDDYNYLRQLFKFNGIPRYVLVNRDGNVVDDNFHGHLDDNILKKLEKE